MREEELEELEESENLGFLDEIGENYIMKEDKIINNSYNTGEIEYEAFSGTMKIDDRVSSLYEDQYSENMYEVRTIKALGEEIYRLFQESPFHKKYQNPKRVDKGDMVKMYYYFKDLLLKEKSYSNAQIFMGFAEFFQINYDQLYTEIGVLDKEGLLRELNSHKGMKSKIQTKKLF
jgi:hypothetical protein